MSRLNAAQSEELERRCFRILDDRRRLELTWTSHRWGSDWIDLRVVASQFEPGAVVVEMGGDPLLVENLEALETFLRDVRTRPPEFSWPEAKRPCPECDAPGDDHEGWCEYVETTS